jgi:glucosamine-6-phosphate deaminase
MGAAAGAAAAAAIREALAKHGEAGVVFAAAPSQNETLDALVAAEGVDWPRVVAFQMDEYVGADAGAYYSFRRYLKEHLVSRVPLKRFCEIRGEDDDPESAANEYAALLTECPPSVCLAGIGENGHLAFNDPEVADFKDPKDVKVVELDSRSREQQVADGLFASADQVPRRAITLTIPRLFRIPTLIISVAGPRKRDAVRAALTGPVSENCPASILRKHRLAHLFLDQEAAALIRT